MKKAMLVFIIMASAFAVAACTDANTVDYAVYETAYAPETQIQEHDQEQEHDDENNNDTNEPEYQPDEAAIEPSIIGRWGGSFSISRYLNGEIEFFYDGTADMIMASPFFGFRDDDFAMTWSESDGRIIVIVDYGAEHSFADGEEFSFGSYEVSDDNRRLTLRESIIDEDNEHVQFDNTIRLHRIH